MMSSGPIPEAIRAAPVMLPLLDPPGRCAIGRQLVKCPGCRRLKVIFIVLADDRWGCLACVQARGRLLLKLARGASVSLTQPVPSDA